MPNMLCHSIGIMSISLQCNTAKPVECPFYSSNEYLCWSSNIHRMKMKFQISSESLLISRPHQNLTFRSNAVNLFKISTNLWRLHMSIINIKIAHKKLIKRSKLMLQAKRYNILLYLKNEYALNIYQQLNITNAE